MAYDEFISETLCPCLIKLFSIDKNDYKWKDLNYNVINNIANFLFFYI